MTQTFDKEKAVACRTRLKIRVSAAVDRLILAKIRCRGLQRRTAVTDVTVQPLIRLLHPKPVRTVNPIRRHRRSFFPVDHWNAAQIDLRKSFSTLKRKGERKRFAGNE
jgi:hypothetical protein